MGTQSEDVTRTREVRSEQAYPKDQPGCSSVSHRGNASPSRQTARAGRRRGAGNANGASELVGTARDIKLDASVLVNVELE